MGRIVGLLLNYRDAERSLRCIHSLLDQGLTHVVIWDNSADGGASAADISTVMANDPRLDFCLSSGNLGFAAGVNLALEYCSRTYRGAWVLLINNDARLLPDGAAKLAQALEANPTAMMAFPNIHHAGHVTGPGYCHRITGLLTWRPRRGCFAFASGCCQLIALDRITLPWFDEDFFMYGEDCELGWRLGQQQGASVHVDEALVEHEGSASSGLGTFFYESHMVAAHLILARKLAQNPWDACLLHVSRAGMLLLRAFVRSLRFRSWTPFKALLDGARMALRHR